MGILAAGFTSLAGAVIMLFTGITFFQKFALVLFLTIVQATIGSFVVFLVMTDCIGPNEPTHLVDRALEAAGCKSSTASETDGEPATTTTETAKTTTTLTTQTAPVKKLVVDEEESDEMMVIQNTRSETLEVS